ncbi:FliH/SctL family protein [Pandoraea sp. CB10b_02]|uniref:FliH/SctL family protein n=1 Tax=Pandoraea sp. CB10b_02 TaxID=2014535 RepID=UPI00257F21E1|nr:FliH/SctL family protein [Pandoraea sp. CB10b_02]
MKPHRFGTKADAAAQRGWLPVQPDMATVRAQAYAEGVAHGEAQARETVWQAAFDAGLAEGEQAAETRLRASYAARLREELDAIAQPLAALQAACDEVRARLAAGALDAMTEATSRAVKTVVQRELQTAAPEIANVVRHLVGQLGADGDVTVYVSPEDARALAARVGAQAPGAAWRIVADASLPRGESRVDVGGLWYDAGCESRESAVREVVRRRLGEWVDASIAGTEPIAMQVPQ